MIAASHLRKSKVAQTVALDGYLLHVKDLFMERILVAGPSITQKEIVPGGMPRFLVVLLICGLSCFSLPNSVMAAAGDLDPTFGSSGKVKTGFLGLGGLAMQ
jgi:hypothetical protein